LQLRFERRHAGPAVAPEDGGISLEAALAVSRIQHHGSDGLKNSMHELSIAMSVVDLARQEGERVRGRVIAVHIKVGSLSGVFKDALLSCYEMASHDTSLQGSQLIIEDVPILIYCPQCRAERTVASMQRFCCSVCSAPASQILRGKELELVSLELES
jgi:hydrogenase nickel incorporation protein HypA/HybF